MPARKTLPNTSPPLLFMLLLLWSPWTLAAQIQAAVDRNPVSLNDSFQIIFTANEEPDGEPDFSPLEKDFSILNKSQSSSYSWTNGKSSKNAQWTLTVMAKAAGTLAVPPIRFGNDASAAVPLEVTQGADTQDVATDKDLFLEVEATPSEPYIQAQVLYTLRLYTRVDIAQAQLNEPELSDAVVEKLGDDSNYSTQVKGVDYSVTERKYAIFPQKSGQLVIKPLQLTANIMTSGRALFNSFFNSQLSRTQRVTSKAVKLNVKPMPANTNGQHWLPAEQLALKQEWSGDITQMQVGEPLTRTLTLYAKGTTVGQLPELAAANTHADLKAYPDQPVLKEQKKPDGVLALREEKIALIPSKAGQYTLPAITIPWFNTQTQKMERVSLPETVLTATGTATQTTAPTPKLPAPATTQPKPVITPEPPPIVPTQVATGDYWPLIAAVLALGWLATLIYFLVGKSTKKPVVDEANAPEQLRLKDIVNRLKKACAENNAPGAKAALLDWGRLQLDATSLGAIATHCEARLRDEILLLNQVLYGKEAAAWQGKRLFQTFTENQARAKLATTEESALKPLYRL
jgi:hypothetical protein